jgi:uncharacterized protein (DUF983 family)
VSVNKRLLLAQIAIAETTIEAMKLAIEEPDAEASEDVRPGKRCPHCGEDEKLEDTSTATERRTTCLACGKSWTFGLTLSEVPANG